MDEFKPEDELKPDASDRRPTRARKPSPAAKAPLSRQHMMMGIGILVLLLLVIGIGSALTGPDEKKPAAIAADSSAAGSGKEKNIDLSGNSSMTGQQNSVPATGDAPQSTVNNSTPQELSAPPVASTPTQAAPVEAPQNQQRVTLPGDLNNALTNQQGQVDDAANGASASGLPVSPATVSGSNAATAPAAKSQPSQPQSPTRHAAQPARQAPAHRPAATASSKPENKPAAPAATTRSNRETATPSSGGNYTLQLSGASRADSLNAWAKKQSLSNYHVYKTSRNGQDWYVLVSGSYATPAEAKRAVASLPAEVRAKNPWVKPVSQVKKEASK